MSKPPPDDELWTTPGPLQPPTEAAAARAKPIFERWLNEVRESAPRAAPAASYATPAASYAAPVWSPGGGRRYDLALTVALGPQQARLWLEAAANAPAAVPAPAPASAPAAMPAATTANPGVMRAPHAPRGPAFPAVRAPVRPEKHGLLPLEDDPTTVSEDSTLEPTVIHELSPDITRTAIRAMPEVPARPPPGAATVRPALKTGQKHAEIDHEVWQQTADTALLRTESDGGMAFDITIRDDVFADLSCTIAVNEGRATATFRVSDANTRRLLEAEVGRLRSALEGRGLRVDQVRVVLDPR